MKYLIIGNSTAGVSAIQALREKEKQASITVISEEKEPCYSRPLISYYLGGKVDREKMLYKDKGFYDDINVVSDCRITKIIPKDKCIRAKNGQNFCYDRLLIATGGSPIVPDIRGITKKHVFNFYSLEDAEAIKAYIHKGNVRKAIVLGGGLIGLKATESLLELGIKVTIVELGDWILGTTFDKDASCIIETALKDIGCGLEANNTIVEIKDKHVILKKRRRIPADLVIIAIGVRPNVELAKSSGIKVNKGIVVDEHMRTNIKDIYSAGDVTEAEDLFGTKRAIAIWPVAAEQGKIAGLNMAGEKAEYKGGMPMNSVELCGIPTISVGLTAPKEDGYEIIKTIDKDKKLYKKIVIKDNRIVGFIFVGDIERAGIYTGLIKGKVDITTFKEYFLKENFGFVLLPESYRKHLVCGFGVEV